jgi:hypothetical protein
MIKSVLAYAYFVGTCLLIFVAHILARIYTDIDPWSMVMLQSYGINAGIGVLLIGFTRYLIVRESSYIGWVFVGLSGLKFVLFFVLIWPKIQLDELTSTAEFTSFFVPYLGCLIMEVRFLAKRLNAL